MAVLHRQTVGPLSLLHVDADPNGTVSAAPGSVALDQSNGHIYINQTKAPSGTDWGQPLTEARFRQGFMLSDTDDATATEHFALGVQDSRLSAAAVNETPTTADHLRPWRNRILFDITTMTTAGTLRLTGTSFDETDGSTTGSDTEDIVISATGEVASTKRWNNTTTVVLSSVGGLDVVLNSWSFSPSAFASLVRVDDIHLWWESTQASNSVRVFLRKWTAAGGFETLWDDTVSNVNVGDEPYNARTSMLEVLDNTMGDGLFLQFDTVRAKDLRFEIHGTRLQRT